MGTSEQKACGACDDGPGRVSASRAVAASGPAGAPKRIAYGLGGVAFVILLVVAFSGIFLAMFYQPGPAEALKSVQFIEKSPAGSFARSLHGWGALCLLVVMILHTISAVYRGAYRAPRQFNWYIGILMLPLICAFVVTGYLLPWDFRSYWTVTTITNWFEDLPLFSGVLHWLFYGDATRGMVPVGRWFTVHAVILPALISICLYWHFALFHKHGSTGPEA